MLDLKFIRENPELVKAGAVKKHVACDVDRLLELDVERRSIGQEVDELRSKQKQAGKAIAKATPEERKVLVAEQATSKATLKEREERKSAIEAEMHELHLAIPNVPDEAVPEGKDDAENVELRTVGELPTFDFETRDHVALANAQGWLDIEAGARLAGSRNYVLLGELALMENAVMSFALDHMLGKGFTQNS